MDSRVTQDNVLPKFGCVFREEISYLACSPVGSDEKNFGEILQETQGLASSYGSKVKELDLMIAGNLTITEQCLENFTNLERFETALFTVRGDHWLNIAPGAFENKPNLTKIFLVRHTFPADTVLAFEVLKNQITEFWMSSCSPNDAVIRILKKFTKLETVNLRLYPSTECPEDLLQGSANTMESVRITGCTGWSGSNISENAIFSNFPRLENLDLEY